MMFIHLHDVLFHALHGVHAEEQLTGGDFLVNVTAVFIPSAQPIQSIDNTVNYVSVYEVVKKRMAQPSPLLETIVMEIADQLLAQFSLIQQVDISIKKLHPTIPFFEGSVGVSYSVKREQ